MCNIKECMYEIQEIANKNDINFITGLIDYMGKNKNTLTEKQTELFRAIYKKYLNKLIDKKVYDFKADIKGMSINSNNRSILLENACNELSISYKETLRQLLTDKNVYIVIVKILKKYNDDEFTTKVFNLKICGNLINQIELIQPLAKEYNIEPIEVINKWFKP